MHFKSIQNLSVVVLYKCDSFQLLTFVVRPACILDVFFCFFLFFFFFICNSVVFTGRKYKIG